MKYHNKIDSNIVVIKDYKRDKLDQPYTRKIKTVYCNEELYNTMVSYKLKLG